MHKLFITLIIGLVASLSFAHPHVWMDSDIRITQDTIDVQWTFDEMFSSIVFSDFDTNEDKKILGDEVAEVKSNMFNNLSKFSFFTTVICGKKQSNFDKAYDFKAWAKDDRIVYSFKLAMPNMKCASGLEVHSFDNSYYSDITIKSAKGNNVSIKEDGSGRQYIVVK